MKKIIHVGILSVGLMLSNATWAETADKFAHMRNSSKNMTTEQAEQVEAGSWGSIARGVGKAVVEIFKKPSVQKGVKRAATGAYVGYEGYKAYQDYQLGDQCR